MQPEELGDDERRRIHDELGDATRELDEIIDHTTRLLGRLSNNLAFVTKPQQEAQLFKHIQLIWLSPHTGVADRRDLARRRGAEPLRVRCRGAAPTT